MPGVGEPPPGARRGQGSGSGTPTQAHGRRGPEERSDDNSGRGPALDRRSRARGLPLPFRRPLARL